MPIEVKPIEARMALTQNGLGKLAINPYQGCAFACEFCSAIKMNYFTGRTKEKWDKTGWGQWVDYKTNLLALLQAERQKIRRAKIYFGNATDLYQPLERKLQLVPPLLEFFLAHPPRELEVQTRAAGRDVKRDIPLLQALAKRTSVLVSYSIHTDREEVRRIFEPKAPSLDAREEGLRAYFEAGIRTRLSCMPMLPLHPENFARRFASYITNHVWVAPMYHRQLTSVLFHQHFPAWSRADFLEARMREVQIAFEQHGIRCYFQPQRDKTARVKIRVLRQQEQYEARQALPATQLLLPFGNT
jgi:DNA repair photolyase